MAPGTIPQPLRRLQIRRPKTTGLARLSAGPATVVPGGVFTGGHYEAYLEKPQSEMPSTQAPCEAPSGRTPRPPLCLEPLRPGLAWLHRRPRGPVPLRVGLVRLRIRLSTPSPSAARK
ncbi:hypothetical protein GUJ93_ZPchr0013g37952 [Zizania palustris]|uniref:Uncharacterized protein n=1 Tax=Zizania palustris TaxID=103762 RepID=A0A8J5X8P1_ZIZPA|nr:hypothetical protein GUJ93_ZPchr0013g37952 [Zizania palustris]